MHPSYELKQACRVFLVDLFFSSNLSVSFENIKEINEVDSTFHFGDNKYLASDYFSWFSDSEKEEIQKAVEDIDRQMNEETTITQFINSGVYPC